MVPIRLFASSRARRSAVKVPGKSHATWSTAGCAGDGVHSHRREGIPTVYHFGTDVADHITDSRHTKGDFVSGKKRPSLCPLKDAQDWHLNVNASEARLDLCKFRISRDASYAITGCDRMIATCRLWNWRAFICTVSHSNFAINCITGRVIGNQQP